MELLCNFLSNLSVSRPWYTNTLTITLYYITFITEKDRQIGKEQSYEVRVNEFCINWPCPDPWSSKNEPGELGWFLMRTFKKEGKCERFEYEDPNNKKWCKGGVNSRYLSSEVGYNLKFYFDENGLPRGCDLFEDPTKTREWYGKQNKEDILGGEPGVHGCDLQDYPDEYGKPMHEAVKLYAEDGDLWIKDFVLAFDKMQQNGNTDLVLGPNNFWIDN